MSEGDGDRGCAVRFTLGWMPASSESIWKACLSFVLSAYGAFAMFPSLMCTMLIVANKDETFVKKLTLLPRRVVCIMRVYTDGITPRGSPAERFS